MKKLLFIIPLILIILVGIMVASSAFGFYNRHVTLETTFEQKLDERKAFFQNMNATFNQKSQIALKNDTAFRKNIEIIMSGRKDSDELMFKMIQESNPNANYNEVSALYKDLSRAVEAKRDEFFAKEMMLQDVTKQHKLLLRSPSGLFFNFFFNKQEFAYKPITSEQTDEVFRTSQENDLNLF